MHVRMHTHTHMHVHAHAYMYKHDDFMQMAAPIGKSLYDIIARMRACVCMSMHVRTCMRHPQNILTESHPHPPTPIPPRGGPRNQSKFNST